jgi:hypothetical protein
MTERIGASDAPPPPPPPPPPPDTGRQDRSPEATPELANGMARDDHGSDAAEPGPRGPADQQGQAEASAVGPADVPAGPVRPDAREHAPEHDVSRPEPGTPGPPRSDVSPELRSAMAEQYAHQSGPADGHRVEPGQADTASPGTVETAEPRQPEATSGSPTGPADNPAGQEAGPAREGDGAGTTTPDVSPEFASALARDDHVSYAAESRPELTGDGSADQRQQVQEQPAQAALAELDSHQPRPPDERGASQDAPEAPEPRGLEPPGLEPTPEFRAGLDDLTARKEAAPDGTPARHENANPMHSGTDNADGGAKATTDNPVTGRPDIAARYPADYVPSSDPAPRVEQPHENPGNWVDGINPGWPVP